MLHKSSYLTYEIRKVRLSAVMVRHGKVISGFLTIKIEFHNLWSNLANFYQIFGRFSESERLI